MTKILKTIYTETRVSVEAAVFCAHKQSQKAAETDRRLIVNCSDREVYKMDEQRTWLRARRKRRLRILAVMLSFCVLFTANPDIAAILSVIAAEKSEGEGRQYVSDFVTLPENVREQKVALGTELDALSLPDTLEAVVTGIGNEDVSEKDNGQTDEEKREDNGSDAGETKDKDKDGLDESNGENGKDGNDSMGEAGDEGGEGGNGSAGENKDEGSEGGSSSADGTKDESNEGTDDSADENADVHSKHQEGGADDTERDVTAIAEGTASEESALRRETYTVAMPEYHAENSMTVEERVCQRDREETILIEGITWDSEPVYDGNTAGTYTFTAVLPGDYMLAEGVSLPEIRVTVQDGSDDTAVQELLARIAALPEAEEILAKEPDAEDEEAYEEWTAELSMYGEEAFAILEAYEELTEEQQAQIPEEAAAKLMAWAELAEMITGGAETYALMRDTDGVCGGGGDKNAVEWSYKKIPCALVIKVADEGKEAPMEDYESLSGAPWSGSNVYQLTIGSGITHIGKHAFAKVIPGPPASDEVTIPNSVQSIGDGAFYLGFANFSFKGTDTIPELGTNCFSKNCTIKIPSCKYYDVYCKAPGWSAYKDNIVKVHALEDREWIEAKEPTCVETGNVAYWRCKTCRELFEDAEQKNPTTLDAVTLPTNDNHSYTYTADGAVITESCANGCGHLATATLSVKSGANLTYTGSEIKPVTVTYSNGWGGTDKPGDTRISYTNNTNAGTATAKLTIGGVTAAVDFRITEAAMTGVTASGYTGTYDGSAHGITVAVPAGATVKYRKEASGSYTLTASPAYTDVGTYTVYYQVTKSNYTSVTGSAQVKINACSISSAAVTLDGTALTYNGFAQTKEISSVAVTADTKTLTLTAGTDYTVSGDQGTDAGTYTMTLTGKGNYTGTKAVNFTIASKLLTAGMLTIADGPYYYTGTAVTPAVTVKDGSRTLIKDTDYTLNYTNNINTGTATVTIEGKGNYKGTVSRNFTIQYRPLPSGKSLTDYVTVSPVPTDDWYNAEITLTPKSGCEAGKTPSEIGSGAVTISEETGADGDSTIIYIRDKDGSIYQTEFTYKLDKTPPVIDLTNMSVTNGTQNVWNWIIGRKSMIIRIPENDITDAVSGVGEVSYMAVPDNGEQQTQTIRAQGGYYEIALNREFTGTIRLTAEDRVGNSTQVSLTTDGGRVIAEDYAPVVRITLPDTPKPNENGWYNTAVSVNVVVTDDKDDKNAGIISGGIAGIKWKDGENGAEQTVEGLPGTSPVCEKAFTISVDTEGTHTYYVKAADNAGNESGWQMVTVKCDTGKPVFRIGPAAINRTQEGADITFTPSEGGKVYWLVDPQTVPDAQEVAEKGAQNGCVKEDVIGGLSNAFILTGLTPGETHTVYAVLEDAAGNLSDVGAVSFFSLQKAPEITMDDIVIDREKETVKLPERIGEVEVYTDPADPAGSRIEPEDGCLPVEPGTTIYIRYPEKTQGSETVPASDSTAIAIPDRPATPSQKQTTVTDTTITITNPDRGEEYILVPKGSVPQGQEPDWSGAVETSVFTGLDPNQEYELWVRTKATGDDFASDPVRTDICTKITVNPPAVEGEGAGKPGNTAAKPPVSDTDEDTVPFTGTYGEEYIPVIKVDGQEYLPEMTWSGTKGTWEYIHEIPGGASEVEVTVEFRKRALTGITVTPDSLKLYADHDANRSAAQAGNMAPLTDWLQEQCRPKAAYDNKTEGTVEEAAYTTTGQFTPKGGVYRYTVSAEGKTAEVRLTVAPVNAAVTAPSKIMQTQKDGGYTQAEAAAWLPAQVAVTYTGTGYTARKENRAVTWNTAAIGADFGGTLGEQTISGTVDLPAWATGAEDVSISIEFVDKTVLTDAQMTLAVSGWSYGAQKKPAPRGSVSVTDTNPVITYLYSADQGTTWKPAEQLPVSGSGHIVPGEYQVRMAYAGDRYTGTKTASFTVGKRPLTVGKGTLEAENKNYDGTRTAVLKQEGAPALSGVLAGDTVSIGGNLRAEFAEAGPKKNIAVTVTGFALEGGDAGYYELGNTFLTLYATINQADGTPPADSQKPGNSGNKDKDKDKDKENNGSSDNGSGNEGDGESGIRDGKVPGSASGTPAVEQTQQPAETRSDPAQTDTSAQKAGEPSDREQPDQVQPVQEPAQKQGEREVQTTSAAERQVGQETDGTDTAGQSESDTVKRVTATVNEGRIVVSGETVSAGNVPGMEQAGAAMELGEGTVFVTVVCAQQECTAGVADTAAVANAVLTTEQQELVNGGETIEIRIDVTDISDQVPERDKEVIAGGIEAYEKDVPGLALGMYVDISMFIKIGGEDWNAVTATEEPIEVVIGIPERLLSDGREFYIIRAHEGEYTFMSDMDDAPDTITTSTDMFSSYAIAYTEMDTTGTGRGSKCGLCHICPTFLGICCFIWLEVIAVAILIVIIVVLRRRKKKEPEEQR